MAQRMTAGAPASIKEPLARGEYLARAAELHRLPYPSRRATILGRRRFQNAIWHDLFEQYHGGPGNRHRNLERR